MALIVLKFGGTSLATPGHILRAANHILSHTQKGDQVVAVVSAMGKMTDELVALSKQVVAHPSKRELDMLLTVGERVSMALVAMALEAQGKSAVSFTGSQVGIITTSSHSDARILRVEGQRVRQALSQNKVVIVAGFQGMSEMREITTLGRGGSDTTAVALAIALGASRCEILTDVEGLFTADPARVPTARRLSSVSVDRALEMSVWGSKMHPRSLMLAKKYGLELVVRSSLNPSAPPTFILKSTPAPQGQEGQSMEEVQQFGISVKADLILLSTQAKSHQVMEFLSTLEASVMESFLGTQDTELLIDCKKAEAVWLSSLPFDHRVQEVAVVTLVGDGFLNQKTLSQKIHGAISTIEGILSIRLRASSASVICSSPHANEVAKKLHQVFCET